MSFNIDDYSTVDERIRLFYEKYPEGRLTTFDWDVKGDLDGKAFVWVHAKAYRDPEDPLPGDGIAWEPVPGPTQFTLNSELMNAQTAAWGRAIVALGFETKKIASADEVRNRQADDVNGFKASRGDAVQPQQMLVTFGKHKGKKVQDVPASYWEWWLSQDGKKDPELLAAVELHMGLTAQPVGPGAPDDLDIPFGPSIA